MTQKYCQTAIVTRHPEHDEAKWIEIIRKTRQKRAHEFALAGRVNLSGALKPLLPKALQ